MPDRPAILLSIRPRFTEMILSKTKTIEIRRVRPHLEDGDLIVIYETVPTQAIVATAEASHVTVASPAQIWTQHGGGTGLSRAEFDSYLEGATDAVAIGIEKVVRLAVPVSLADLQARMPGFVAPQSFRYLDGAATASLGPEVAARG